MADLHVKVKDSYFEPSSQNGHAGQSVKFKNDRSSEATIDLDPNFYDTSQIKVSAGGEKKVNIKSDASGTGPFSTDQLSKKRETVNGDIVIVPRK